MDPQIRPFPWHALIRIKRRDLSAIQAIRHLFVGNWTYALGQLEASFQPMTLSREHPPILRQESSISWGSIQRVQLAELGWLEALQTQRFNLHGGANSRGFLFVDLRLVGALLGGMLHSDPIPLLNTPSAAEKGLISYVAAKFLYDLCPSANWILDINDERPLQLMCEPEQRDFVLVEIAITLNTVHTLAYLLISETMLLRSPRQPAPFHRSTSDDPIAPNATMDGTPPQRHLARRGRLNGVRCYLAIELTRFSIPAIELEQLSIGDTILSPHCPRHDPAQSCALRVGEGAFDGRATFSAASNAWSVCIQNAFEIKGMRMTETATDKTRLAESLPAELVIELGRLQMTGKHILEFEPGDVLTLNRPTSSWVDIRVGDKLIARGELVDVEGEAGVRILDLYD